MKKLLKGSAVFALLIIFLIFQVSAASGYTTVYITDTGEKYHSSGCQYLRKSCNSISLIDAVRTGYTRCSKCSPPKLDATSNSTKNNTNNLIPKETMDAEISRIVSEYETILNNKNKELEIEREENRTEVICIAFIAACGGLWFGYVFTSASAGRKINKLEKALSEVTSNYNNFRKKHNTEAKK